MPLPSTRQSHMSVFHGKAPAIDDNHQIDNLSFMVNVVAKTADYSVLAKETGTHFTTTAATGGVNFTLPAVATSTGCIYWFSAEADFEIMVSAPANTLVAGNDATATSVAWTTATQQIGGGFMAFCDGTLWYAFNYAGQNDSAITIA